MTKKQRRIVQKYADTYNMSDNFWRKEAQKLWDGKEKPILPIERDMLDLKDKITSADLLQIRCEQVGV